METPATIRRNPPRKAKLSSTEKTTVKEYRSTRKRYAAEGKALMPSFIAAEEDSNPRLKQTEEACPRETHQAENLSQQSIEGPKNVGDGDSQQKGSVNDMHVCVTKSFAHENSVQISVANPMNVAELEKPSPTISVEKLTATSRVGFEAESSQCEAPSARASTKQGSGKVRVFLRIRPAQVTSVGKLTGRAPKIANRSAQHGKRPREETTSNAPDVCLWSQTSDCVTLVTPSTFLGSHKPKVEEFNGFSRIFNSDSTQEDVFNEILAPRLVDLLNGKSSVVVAMGPTSAGKTHTMLGTPGDPGLLPQSLQYLLGANLSERASSTMRVVIISMFEIYSEQGGRFEKILDLLHDGAELSLQQSKIKGLHEATVSTVEEANAILLNGLQKRTTATTAANHQSSRSHCIINISACQVKHCKSVDALISSKRGTLTVADLAGFERERKTKNQGVRLNESGFINNTSMVFGQCLRALLEHQKNPKKTLQRHFQYSMLTRYLKPYMEANGDMTLIVNVSPCEEDYLDTAFVLRQAAPYSNIKLSLLPTKDNVENLAVEKRVLSYKERQQPVKKRRKVDGAANASVNLLDCSNISKLETRKEVLNTMPDLGNESQRLAEELQKCQAEAAEGIAGETREDSEKTDQTFSSPNTTDELKATLLAEVNSVLVREGVERSDRVSLALMKVLDTAVEHYHGLEDLEGKLQQQHAEITLLSTNLLKEQKSAFALSKELETLKKYCECLENQLLMLEKSSLPDDANHSRPSVSAQTHSFSERNIQDIAERQAQTMECTVPDRDIGVPILAACSSTILTKNLCDVDGDGSLVCTNFSTHNNLDGQIKADAHSINDPSARLSMVLPLEHNNCEEVRELEDLNSGKTVPSVNECKQAQASGACTNNTLVTFGTHNGQDKELQVCDPEDDLDLATSTLQPTEGVQCLNSQLFLSSHKRTTEGQMACQLALEDDEYHDQQRAHHESSQISQVNALFPGNLEVSEVADEEQVKYVEEMGKCKSPSVIMLDRDCKLHLSDHETCRSEEYFKMEHGKKSPPPCVQELLGLREGQTTCSTAVEKAGSPQSYMKEGKHSNLQKGRLLALSLMQESKLPNKTQSDQDHLSVHQPPNTPTSIGTIGPIGHDLEELLKIPLSEVEKELWVFEEATGPRGSDLLAKCNGLLEVNKFPQKYSQQRANCIRYCLAVICGKMNVDGEYVPLGKETLAPRKRHFYAVIQAQTVTEAAGHARAGIQVETLSNYNKTEIQREQPGNAIVEAEDNKENTNCSPVATKANAPPKRRRLQPLSSLSLHTGPMCPDLEFIDASAEEVYSSKSTLEGHTSKVNSLAHLLIRHNR